MTTYYLCSTVAAQLYCIGLEYKPVHYRTANDDFTIRDQWLSDDGCLIAFWSDAVLLKNIDKDMQLLLSLADTLFTRVSPLVLSSQVRSNRSPWKTYE